jgi:hypothetical protein
MKGKRNMIKKSILLATALALGITTASIASAQPSTVTSGGVGTEEELMIKSSLQEQLEMLERGIVPTTPEETISTWAKAVKNRNGALQYALFVENLKLGQKQAMEQFHWVTGASSPWVESYKVISQIENPDKTLDVVVEFDLATSTGYAGKDQAKLTLVKINDQWFIKDLGPSNEQAVGIWTTPESINELNIEKNLKDVKTIQSSLGYNLQLLKNDLDKITLKDSTCKNEEGNPPCTHYYYKDTKAKKNILILSVIRLTEKQVKSNYYKDHPFIKKLGTNGKDTFYSIKPSELPYAKSFKSEQANEWSYLRDVLEGRLESITFKK